MPRTSVTPSRWRYGVRGASAAGRWLCGLALGVALSPAAPAPSLAAQSPETASALVRGRVVEARTARPLANARVVLMTASRETRTDAAGRFELGGIVAGPHALAVSAVGYEPVRAEVVLVAASPLELDIELVRVAPMLDSVVAEASADVARNPALAEFESRRKAGFGRFLTREQLVRERGRSLDAVLRSRVPGVRILDDGHRKVAASGRANGRIVSARACLMNVMVDGVLVYDRPAGISAKEPFDLRTLDASMIAGVEVYNTASMPAEFNMGSDTPCGVLVIWLQH